MHDTDILAMRAKESEKEFELLVKQNEGFILKCTNLALHKYITKSDDEWSIALSAFSQAVKDYSSDKGGFLGFASLVIRRRLVDYIRQEVRHSGEVLVSPAAFDSDIEEDDTDLSIKLEVSKKISISQNDSIKLEIEAVTEVFSQYGFTFFELASCSPKAEKTKKACAVAVSYIVRNSNLLSEMKATKLLPAKQILENTKLQRKILERHRKYIIAAAEIITGDYPYLAGYLQYIREELKNESCCG